MKNITFNLLLVLLFTLTLAVSEALPANTTDNFYYNPLLLNGKSMNIEKFSVVAKGVLGMIGGNSESGQREKIPFFIYLKRAGKIVDASTCTHNHPVMAVEISEVLKFAKAGDELIIDPANKTEKAGRRVLTVKNYQPAPQFNWFYGLGKKDKC